MTPGVDASVPAAPGMAATGDALTWKMIAAGSSIGWLATLAYLVFNRRSGRRREATVQGHTGNDSERQAFRQLLAACKANDPTAARRALITWGRARFSEGAALSLAQLGAAAGDAAFGKA